MRRIIALLMILALSVSFVPAAYAAETDGTIPEDQATSPPETTPPTDAGTEPSATDPTPTEEASAPDSSDSENPDAAISVASDDGIAMVADAEIVGNPTTFATLFLKEAIQIPSFDHLQSKEHVPLYSVYLKNQPGYENNYYIAYCIEPGIVQDSAANYDGNSSTLGALGSDSTVFTYLTPAQLRAMGVALLYGQMEIARKADAENVRLEKLRRWASTQLIIWEIAAGWRSTTPPYICNNDTLYDAVTPTLEAELTMDLREWYITAAKQFKWTKTQLVEKINANIHEEIVLDIGQEICDNTKNPKDRNTYLNTFKNLIPKFRTILMRRRCRGKTWRGVVPWHTMWFPIFTEKRIVFMRC